MGAVVAACGAEIGGEAGERKEAIEPGRDFLHRGLAGGDLLGGQAALIVALDLGPQEEVGDAEFSGSAFPLFRAR